MRERLSSGAPLLLVAAIAAAALLALVVVAALRGADGASAWAYLRVTETDCQIDEARSRNLVRCFRVAPRTYRLVFGRSLEGRVAVATSATCCPGTISADVLPENHVLVALPPETDYPALFAVAVP